MWQNILFTTKKIETRNKILWKYIEFELGRIIPKLKN